MRFSYEGFAVSASCLFISSLLVLRAGQLPDGTDVYRGKAIRVLVEMVSLPVIVTDRMGNHITGLQKENFAVYDNGALQEIAGFAAIVEPISVALALDTSGSTEFQLRRIQDEAIRFVNLLKPDDSVAILSFADGVRLLEHFSLYHKKNPDVIRRIRPGGLSAVYEAVRFALENVLKPEYGRKALVLFSDGVDNRSENVTAEETLELARQTDAPIYCVYFNTDRDRSRRIPRMIDPLFESFQPSLVMPQRPPFNFPKITTGDHPEFGAGHEYMMKLSQYSGGFLFEASKADNLRSAFQRVARELSNQYSIGYYPKALSPDGEFHKVEVRVNKPGLKVRTRQGYFNRLP
jgi:Ca-activated chloride channel family protein